MSFDLDSFWTSEAKEHLDTAQATFETTRDTFSNLLDMCAGSINNGGKIIFFGNGGSAADAQHLAT